MIIVSLMGGLGNQMFQYAFGRSLSQRLGCQFKLDTSFLDYRPKNSEHTLRSLELNIFAMDVPLADQRELRGFQPVVKSRDVVSYVFRKLFGKPIIMEHGLAFDSAIRIAKDGSYFSGFWQSTEYFDDYAYSIRKDFTFRFPLTHQNKEMADEISNSESTSIHVRRGDYLSNASAKQVHGVCTEEYYHTAIKCIKDQVLNPRFFIFSDDPQWAKQTFAEIGDAVFVEQNLQVDQYRDMQLMSLCKHHIIANSSFSWWGAWLNPKGDEIVIAPKKWYMDEKKNQEASGLIPASWLRV